MGIPTSSWACTTNSWAAPAQRTGADLPATLVCWQLGILHQQLGLLGRLPAGLALERPVWSCHGLDTWLLLRLRSCTRTAMAQGWTDGMVVRYYLLIGVSRAHHTVHLGSGKTQEG